TMLRTRSRRTLYCAAVATLGWGSISYGDVDNWTNTFGGTFNVAGNWNPTVPGASSTAVFGINASYNVKFTFNSPVNSQLSVNNGVVSFVNDSGPRTYFITGPGAFIAGSTTALTL